MQLRSKENKNSVGARVRVTGKTATGKVQSWYHTIGDGGTFGSNSMELEIGLGAVTEIIEVRIDWPGRKTEVYKGLGINKAWICKEGLLKAQLRKLKRNPLKGNSGSKACCK